MVYTDMTKEAMRIAFDAHIHQTDKAGLPYIFHPYHLAEQMDTAEEICVALLHDVVEDTDISLDDLRKKGFPPSVIEALSLLTHESDVDYFDYIAKIKENNLAKKVKLADLRHNSDITRLNENNSQKDDLRRKKYLKAIELLGGKA